MMKPSRMNKLITGLRDLLLSIVQVDPLLHQTKLELHRIDSNIFR